MQRVLVAAASAACLLAFRLALPSRMVLPESRDYVRHYEPIARLFLDQGNLLQEGHPATSRPPGFPILLAGTFALADLLGISETTAVTGLSLVAFAVASICILELSAAFWPRRHALIAALAFMTYPCVLYLTKQPNSEGPFLPCLYGSVFFFWKAVQGNGRTLAALTSGLLAGAAMLMRPVAVLLGVLLSGFSLLKGHSRGLQKLGIPAAILLGNLAVVLPWEIWVYRNGGGIVPLATHGDSSFFSGLTFSAQNRNKWSPKDVVQLQRGILDRVEGDPYRTNVISVLREEAKAHPVAMARLLLLKVARSWFGTDSGRLENVVLAIQAIYVPVLILCLAMTYRTARHLRPIVVLTTLLVLYFWGMSVVVDSMARYMIPVIGLLFPFLPVLLQRKRHVSSTAGV